MLSIKAIAHFVQIWSEIFAHKNINMTSFTRHSRLHTASETFVRHKKIEMINLRESE